MTSIPETSQIDTPGNIGEVERLRREVNRLKKQQASIVQQQVAAKLKERERELAEIDRDVAERKAMLAGLQRHIDRYSHKERELKIHMDVIEKTRIALAYLAANLEGFGEVIDRDNELRQWRALSQMLKNGAEAIDYFVWDEQKSLMEVVS